MGAREVAAGAEWLDSNFPGWEREIDLGTLNIGSCDNCILGQALREKASVSEYYDGFEYGYKHAGVKDEIEWVITHGFAARRTDEQLWRELIKERFSSGNLSDI